MRALRTLAAACALLACLATTASAARKAETRCGILSNPTPANWWLDDRDGEWIIGVQGGYQAEGIDRLPEGLFEKGWVRTNGYYGYRCACLSVTTDRKQKRILEIFSGKPRPLQACKADKALQKALRSAG